MFLFAVYVLRQWYCNNKKKPPFKRVTIMIFLRFNVVTAKRYYGYRGIIPFAITVSSSLLHTHFRFLVPCCANAMDVRKL